MPAQVPVTEHRVPVAGRGSLWCWDTGGGGSAVILLHPHSGSGESWPYQQPVLAAAGHRVIGYSRRGTRGSAPGTRTRTGTGTGTGTGTSDVADLNALADHLGLTAFHLVGAAAGGRIALAYALAHGTRLLGLTLSGSALDLPVPARVEALPVEFRELGPAYRARNPDGVAAWLAVHERAGTATGPPPPLPPAAPEALARPVQLITGDADPYCPPSRLRHLARRFGDAEAHIVAGAGHNPHWERPDTWNRLLIRFLNR
ncbi:alpha/beta hydrolase [Streptomyces sp. NPDC048277]|uniref:alpha/beta fold hydrolase n=1 Tax=Streptomyces sp. NPDC048277 TaxID=3155027 RepID=UPI00340C4ECB